MIADGHYNIRTRKHVELRPGDYVMRGGYMRKVAKLSIVKEMVIARLEGSRMPSVLRPYDTSTVARPHRKRALSNQQQVETLSA